MGKSYYKFIEGKTYDRNMLDVASQAAPRKRGKPIIDMSLAQNLFQTLADRNTYTDIEKRTMKYIRENFAFTKEADTYIHSEIRKLAAKLSWERRIAGTEPSQNANQEMSPQMNREFSIDSEFYRMDDESDENSGFREFVVYKSIDAKNQRRKKRMIRIVLLGLFLLMIMGIIWSVCVPKTEQNAGFETLETSGTEIRETPPSAYSSQITDRQNEEDDEFAGELNTAAPVRKIPVDPSDLKSSIRYINSLRIGFVKNQSQLTQETKQVLDELANVLRSHSNFQVRIKGHTCWIGSREENQKLSDERAKSVYDYLVSRGVDRSQLETRGYGEISSIATNRTKEGRQENRRVEFEVLQIRD